MVDVRLLGPVVVEAETGPVHLSSARERALVARLALASGHSVDQERLLGDLWGEATPRSGASSLQSLVYRVRRSLGPAGIVVAHEAGGYALDVEPDHVDALCFEQLVREARRAREIGDALDVREKLTAALSLWRGPPLAGLEDFPFVGAQAARLGEARLGALEDRFDTDLATGHHSDLVPELEALVREHPFRERLWRQLMVALYRSGSQAGALRAYTRLRSLLAEELGIAPSPATRDLEQAMLRQDPLLDELLPVEGAVLPARPAATAHIAPDLESLAEPDAGTTHETSDLGWLPGGAVAGFVGRDEELELASQLRDGPGATAQRLLLISGEPGIGKTRLAGEIARRADARGDLIVYGHWDEEAICPFQAFRGAFGRYARRCPVALLAADVRDHTGPLGRIVPELIETLGGGEDPQRSDPEAERYRVFEAIEAWVRAIAKRRRLVVVLDDLQWADRPSLALLEVLLRSVTPEPVLFIGTYRRSDAAVTGWLSHTLIGLRRNVELERIALDGISPAATRSMIEEALGRTLVGEETTAAVNLQRFTGGNPFFLQEVARDLSDVRGQLASWLPDRLAGGQMPRRLQEVVEWRLHQLSAECVQLLGIASVMGEEFDVAVVGDVAGGDEGLLLSAISEARGAGVLSETAGNPDRRRFAHAVVRRALYDRLDPSRRVRLHRELGAALERRYGAQDGGHLAELAHHFAMARPLGETERAVTYACRAGAEAMTATAWEEAARYYEDALGWLDEAGGVEGDTHLDILLELIRARLGAADTGGAIASLRRARGIARELGQPAALARTALTLDGEWLMGSGELDDLRLSLLEEAASRLDDGDPALRAAVVAALAVVTSASRPGPIVLELSAEAVDIARRAGDGAALAAALFARHQALRMPSDTEERIALARQVLELATAVNDPVRWAVAQRALVTDLLELGDIAAADDELSRYAEVAAKMRRPVDLWLAARLQATRTIFAGDLVEGERMAAAALRTGIELGQTAAPTSYSMQVFWLRWMQGRLAELVELIDDPSRLPTSAAPVHESIVGALIHAAAGDAIRAAGLLTQTNADFSDVVEDNLWLPTLVVAAEACARLGERERSNAIYDLLSPYEARNALVGGACAYGATARAAGIAAMTAGRLDDAVRSLTTAVTFNDRMGARAWSALSRTAGAQAHELRGTPSDNAAAGALRAEAAVELVALGIADPYESSVAGGSLA